ncbi:MAG TPA: right-handed parallel beta-helix repeat-containing protein, partial [bacterium]|nr:right-handed parallel beta-helix repeat-containing protein [bacterium]
VPASCKVVYVASGASGNGSGTSWENACTDISTGLGKCNTGDEVWVAAGRYAEAIEMKPGVVLYGGFSGQEQNREERDWAVNETIIDAAGLGKATVTGADDAILDGFTLTGGEDSGLYCHDSSPTVTNCTITGNRSSYGGGGVDCWGDSFLLLDHCTITGNTTERDGGGVFCDMSFPTLTDCVIAENTAQGGGGVACSLASCILINCTILNNRASVTGGGGILCEDSSATLTNCLIARNAAPQAGGVYCRYESSLEMTNCTVVDNAGGGISLAGRPGRVSNCILWNPGTEIPSYDLELIVEYSCIQRGWPGEGNINVYPRFVDPTNGDYRLQNGSPCIDRALVSAAPDKDVEGRSRPGSDDLVDMGAYESAPEYRPGEEGVSPSRLYVRADAAKGGDGLSWQTALPLIEEAVRRTWADAEIWVAAGTYRESVGMESGVAIYGGFSGSEETREERDPSTINATGLNMAAVTGADAILDGFTITGGDNSGVYCYKASPTITNCTITGNTSPHGGGISCNAGSSPTLQDCTIEGNTASQGGGVFTDSSSPSLTDCTVSDNEATADGGGIYCCYDSSPTLADCSITKNTAAKHGGGISLCGGSFLTSTYSAITENAAAQGGGMSCEEVDTRSKLTSCTITRNTATEAGGGLYFQGNKGDYSQLRRCTISENKAIDSGKGGGIYCADCLDYSSPDFLGCPITGNSAAGDGGAVYGHAASPRFTNCTISENTSGGNGGAVCAWSVGISYSFAGFARHEDWSLRDSVITGNATLGNGGAVYGQDSWIDIFGCTLNDNLAYGEGGAVYVEDCDVLIGLGIIKRNTVNGNGGAVWARNSDINMSRSIIRNNRAQIEGGVMYAEESHVRMSNWIMTGNTAGYVGGICCANGDVEMINCTMTGNSGGDMGGIVLKNANTPNRLIIDSCILWNLGAEIYVAQGTAISVAYSCIQDGWPGRGNIDSDPLFVRPWDGEGADVHLRADSPCVDAGDPYPDFGQDASRPPGLGTERRDMGAYGGANEGWPLDIEPKPTPTPTPPPVGVQQWRKY